MAGMEELLFADVLAGLTQKGSRFLVGGSREISGWVGKSFLRVGCLIIFFPINFHKISINFFHKLGEGEGAQWANPGGQAQIKEFKEVASYNQK